MTSFEFSIPYEDPVQTTKYNTNTRKTEILKIFEHQLAINQFAE
jgi:hypothetical protein